jgi:hypothetical protein
MSHLRRGKSLIELATELQRVQNTAKDFLVPTSKLTMGTNGKLSFSNGSTHEYGLNGWSSGQLANYTDIPKGYYDRVKTENPKLFAENVNHGLERKSQVEKSRGEKRMIRTLDGNVRAFVSDKFRRGLGNFELLEANLPILIDNGFEVQSSELTEKRLYVKAVTPKVKADIKVGDTVNFGIVLSNSDVGAGEFKLETFIYRLSCLNGMVGAKLSSARHITRAISGGEEAAELFSDKTLNLSDAAFFSGMRDLFLNAIKPENFDLAVNKMREAAERKIQNTDLEQVVELAMNTTKTQGEGIKHGILAALMTGNEGAGLTQWGLANSFTRAAQDVTLSYDTATELERAGGAIIELGASQWKNIAQTA